MKLPLASGVLSAAILTGCGTPTVPTHGHFVLRVDRTFDRKAQPALPDDELPAEAYRDTAPADRWEVALDGTSLTLTELGESAGAPHRFEGREAASTPGERRFRIGVGKGLDFPNGRFVLRGDEAEVTLYGSGVPVVRSERGKLLLRRP